MRINSKHIRDIRADFPILEREVHGKPLVYLDNAATTHKPQQVLDRVQQFYRESNSNVHRGAHYLSEQASEAYENARKKTAGFINAPNDYEVIFTKGTTDSINLVASSFGDAFVSEGDEIILSEMEHHSNIVPWQMMCERYGAKIKTLPVSQNGTLEPDELEKLITPKTRLVCLAYVSHVLGTQNDIKKLIQVSHNHEVPVLVDGAQAVQHFPVDVKELDCDFFAFSGHKIYAETGIGVLYGKEKWMDAMPPYQGGGAMISKVEMEKTSYGELPLKFEAGTGNYVAAASLGEAIDYVGHTGMENISEHENEVTQYAAEQLRSTEGVTLYGDPPVRCSVLSFNLEGVHPYDAGMILDKKGIAVRTGKLCAEPLMRTYNVDGMIRASFGMYNTTEEVDHFIEGVKTAQAMLQL